MPARVTQVTGIDNWGLWPMQQPATEKFGQYFLCFPRFESLPGPYHAVRRRLIGQTWWNIIWLTFPPQILEHVCPFFIQIAQMGLILPRWGLICPDNHPHPLFFTQQSHTPFWDMYIQNTPFLCLNMKVGQMNYCLGKMRPILAIPTKSEQNFSRSWQKK